jgi:hypothetical protein
MTMKAVNGLFGVILLAGLAACSEGAAPVPAQVSSNAEGQAGTKPTPVSDRVELPVTLEAGEPLLMGAGGVLTASLSVPKSGLVDAVGIQIGNFGGASDGQLMVRLCQQDQCIEGRANLQGSADNEYFMVTMDRPFQLASDVPLVITVARMDGTGQFAVWTYPADGSLTTPDGKTLSRSPRVALQYRG